jgi:glycerophosphoryl diester phosphodiesterase
VRPLLISHRGDAQKHPENTLEAFQSAFDLGADGIEFDVHCSPDGKLVVVHDYTHDPEIDYPCLEQVLERFAAHGRLEIEIKAFEEVCVEKIARVIQKYQPGDIEVTSSELPLLPVIRKHFPERLVGLIIKSSLIEDWMPEDHIQRMLLGYLKLTGANVLHLGLDFYSEELVTTLKEKGYRTHTHLPLEKTGQFSRVQALGLDQCTFDDLSLLKIFRDPTNQ